MLIRTYAVFFSFIVNSLFISFNLQGQIMLTPFELNNNSTATYDEVIEFYSGLDQRFDRLQMIEIGSTDAGKPLHACIMDARMKFKPDGRLVYFVNNGIHPGEPCGIDASMIWSRELLTKGNLPKDIVIIIIPVYNVGGALNRNSTTRVNQDGPEAHGFRGNAKNLDLNRDFIKCDSRNARSFNEFYAKWKPHIFVDTHTSNGADYQHTISLINTQADRLPQAMSTYLRNTMLPFIYEKMETKSWPLTPYVYAPSTPDEGIYGFLDLPRYSSGYAALHHAYSFMSEAHMLKPFSDRVQSTKVLLDVFLDFAKMNTDSIHHTISEARKQVENMHEYRLNWTLDLSRHSKINFKGYEASYKPSEVTGLDRLYYDHSQPYEKEVPWFEFYKTNNSITIPKAYVIPAAYYEIADRLFWNGIEVDTIRMERTYTGAYYRITSFETIDHPYEGHYLHSNIKTSEEADTITALTGDFYVDVNQEGWRYILETLEPESPDSYLAWNFMDPILQRKEYFSSYVFDDLAAELLKNRPELRKKLNEATEKDSSLKANARAQLKFIYEHSKWSEDSYLKYPIFRITQ